MDPTVHLRIPGWYQKWRTVVREHTRRRGLTPVLNVEGRLGIYLPLVYTHNVEGSTTSGRERTTKLLCSLTYLLGVLFFDSDRRSVVGRSFTPEIRPTDVPLLKTIIGLDS